MKMALKIIGIIFLILIILGNIGRIILKRTYESSFEGQIKRANRDCPIPIANGAGQVSKIELDGNFLTYYLDYKPEFINIQAYRQSPEAAKDLFYLSLICLNAQNNNGTLLITELLNNQYGLKVIVSDGKYTFSSEMSPNYLKEMNRKVNLNPQEALHDALLLKFQTESEEFPVKVEEGMFIIGMNLEDNNIVVEVVIDEDIYDLNLLSNLSETIAQSLIDEANAGEPEIGALLDLCKISHTGLVYRMRGMKSNQRINVKLERDKIMSERRTPLQVNIH